MPLSVRVDPPITTRDDMATTKKAVKFYADPEIEKHLETIPPQLRTNWINTVLGAAIEGDKKKAVKNSELQQLRTWLKKQENSPPLYGAMAELLDDYSAS
jgi:hypothetical protein